MTSWSSSSAVGPWPSDQSSRSRSPASRRANQSLPNSRAQEVAQLRLERPRAEVAGDVERAVDVVEVALGVRRELQRVGRGARRSAARIVVGVRPPGRTRSRRGASRCSGAGSRGAETAPSFAIFADAAGRRGGGSARRARRRGARSSAAQPSVTAMSPSRFASIGRSARGVRVVLGVAGLVEERAPVVLPPIGWITSITFPGTSIGEQNARGVFAGALLEVEVDVLLRRAGRSRGRPASPRAPAASGRRVRAGRARARGRAARRPHGRASESPIPSRSRKSRSPCSLPQPLGLVEERAALARELVEPEAEALVELVVVRRAELDAPPRGRSRAASR